MSYTNPKTMDNVSDDSRKKIVRSKKRSMSVPLKSKKYLSTKSGKNNHQHTYKSGNMYSSSNENHKHKISSNGRTLLAGKTGHKHTLVKIIT